MFLAESDQKIDCTDKENIEKKIHIMYPNFSHASSSIRHIQLLGYLNIRSHKQIKRYNFDSRFPTCQTNVYAAGKQLPLFEFISYFLKPYSLCFRFILQKMKITTVLSNKKVRDRTHLCQICSQWMQQGQPVQQVKQKNIEEVKNRQKESITFSLPSEFFFFIVKKAIFLSVYKRD